MTVLQDKSYILWFSWLGDKLLEWSESKPANKDLKNSLKATREIGMYVNQLQTENHLYLKRISLLRSEKNQAILKVRELREEINKTKQMNYHDEIDPVGEEKNTCVNCGAETNETYCSTD